jgi:hypothetical protein
MDTFLARQGLFSKTLTISVVVSAKAGTHTP